MFKSQIGGLALDGRKCSEMGPEWSPGPENRPPGMPRPFSRLWDRSRGPNPPKYSPNSRSTAPGGRYVIFRVRFCYLILLQAYRGDPNLPGDLSSGVSLLDAGHALNKALAHRLVLCLMRLPGGNRPIIDVVRDPLMALPFRITIASPS